MGHNILRLMYISADQGLFEGTYTIHIDYKDIQAMGHKIQIIFQDTYVLLNTRMKIIVILCV